MIDKKHTLTLPGVLPLDLRIAYTVDNIHWDGEQIAYTQTIDWIDVFSEGKHMAELQQEDISPALAKLAAASLPLAEDEELREYLCELEEDRRFREEHAAGRI